MLQPHGRGGRGATVRSRLGLRHLCLALLLSLTYAAAVFGQPPVGSVPPPVYPPAEVPLARLGTPVAGLPLPPSPPGARPEKATPSLKTVWPSPDEIADPLPPVAPAKKEGYHLEASWDNGLLLASADDQFHVHVGGNAQIDSIWLIGPKGVFALPSGGTNGVENASATLLRRARFRFDGDLYGRFDYAVEYDLANANNENDGLQPPSFGNITGAPAPCNIWMQVRDVPVVGDLRFGNQVKPIGMTNNTNQAFLPFMERPDNNDAFYGPFDSGFALGLSARDRTVDERLTWQYGIYRPSTNVFGVSLDKYSVGGRVTALPVYEDEGRRLVHVGMGFWQGELVQNEIRLRARPLLRNAPGYAVPILVDTGNLPGSRQYTLAPEFALVLGSLTVQAEWTGQFVSQAVASNGVNQGTVFFHGGYVEALYFLTGEHQAYEKRDGAFGRVIPRNNYQVSSKDWHAPTGAWQVGTRFSYLDLNDKAIQGGRVYDWTFGVNCILNPNMRLQFNYILEHRDGQQNVAQGWINGLGMRFGYDF